jgi:hypothetical protein
MERLLRRVLVVFGLLVVLGSMQGLAAFGATAELPLADVVVRKVVDRAKINKARDLQKKYCYVKSTSTEEFDSDGRVVRKRDKAVQVFLSRVGSTPIKVAVTDRLYTDQELERLALGRDDDDDDSDRDRKKRNQPRIDLTEEVVKRFDFTMDHREMISGRPTLVLTFAPKRGVPVRQIQDRFLNEAVGTVWIDERESEVVKADIRLREPVSISGGLVAAVQVCHYFMERTRVEPGVWLLKQTELFIRGRQLFSPIHSRKQENWSGFKKPSDEKPG